MILPIFLAGSAAIPRFSLTTWAMVELITRSPMSIEKEPAKKAPWPPVARDDDLHRYPELYRLGQAKHKDRKEGWASIANDHALEAADLVRYNFHTRDPKEINWYLAKYVGCTVLTPDRRNYTFDNVVVDEAKHRGVIFIPRYGDPAVKAGNRLGNQVVDNYNKSTNKEPGGKCHRTCYARVREASRQNGGTVLPEVNWDDKSSLDDFAIIWSSHVGDGKRWRTLPEKYRGKGAAGAMAMKGWGTLVEGPDIWAGKLKPGAVIQAWIDAKDHDKVRDGNTDGVSGHSFIFLHYVRSGSSITGMVIADQGYQNGYPLKRSDYGYWVGANIDSTGTADR
jgi:hypothetical protein